MSHRTNGLYRLLERPALYDGLQKLLGADPARSRFVSEFLRPFDGARLLDIGCGTASLLDHLPQGVEYVGFDLNAAYIERARLRHRGRGRYFCARAGDGLGPEDEHSFDFVVAKSLLHHLDDEEAHRMLDSAVRLLREGGVLVTSDNVHHSRQRRLARFLTSLDRGGSVRTPGGYRALAEAHFRTVESWLITDMVRIPYDHFIMRAQV